MNRPLRPWYEVIDLHDGPAISALGEVLRAWEPALELELPPRDALLYETDGTLYAVQLRESEPFEVRSRFVTVRRGDLIVVPRGLAVDAGPEVDLVAVRHLGTPPDHFRERFIQVWGIDHHPAPTPSPGRSGLAEIVPAADFRLRVPYAIGSLDERDESGPLFLGAPDPLLLIGLEGQIILESSAPEDRAPRRLAPRSIMAVPPGDAVRASGTGRFGVMTLLNELAHEARRYDPRLRAMPPSPEYRPGSPRDTR